MPRRPIGLALPAGIIKKAAPHEGPLLEKRFELGEILGQGAFATVRKVTKQGNATPGGAPLITKTYKTNDEEMINIANREFQVLRLVRGHPNVMQCKEIIVDTPNGRVDLVLRLAPGISLSRLVSEKGRLNEDQSRPILVGLLQALLWCHSRRVVHRDVKPDNIIVDEARAGGTGVVLCDFNTACCLGRNCSDDLAGGVTPTGMATFAVGLMSRELANCGCPGEMVDVWAAGLCLYYMLAGPLPSGKGWSAMLKSVRSAEEIDLETLAGISEEALDLVQSLLRRDVVSRMLVCGALAHAWCKISLPTLNELLFADERYVPMGTASTLCLQASPEEADGRRHGPMRVSFQAVATHRHSDNREGVSNFGMTPDVDLENGGYQQANGVSEVSSALSTRSRTSEMSSMRRFKRARTVNVSGALPISVEM